MSLQFTINSALLSDFDNEKYEQELIKQRQKAEKRLREEEEQQQAK